MAEIGAAKVGRSFETQAVVGILLGYLVISLVVVLSFPGTYDAGDSVMHYQIARYSTIHQDNLLSHWGKPFFTLVAAPFAIWGFWGIKFFQCLLAFGTGLMSFRIAKKLMLRPAWLAPILIFAAPEFFLSQQSGLTEPFFAFMLTLGVFLMVQEKYVWAAIALSFLPFVRTEGFLVLPAFGLYLLWRRQWRAIPMLGLGTAVYAVLGGIFLGDFLWIWTQNPYAKEFSNYGKGTIWHFPEQYVFVVGIPIYALTALGLLLLPFQRKAKEGRQWPEKILLIAAPFLIYFGAHMYFWVTGTGHSMGLTRVMIAIVPLGGLMALMGLQTALDWFPSHLKTVRNVLVGLILAYILAFPFLPNPAAIHLNDLDYSKDQKLLIELADYMKSYHLAERLTYCSHPSAAYFIGMDPFDRAHLRRLHYLTKDNPPPGTMVVWDSWFGVVESGVTREFLDLPSQPYRLLKSWETQQGNTVIALRLYEKI
jgi:hypothetical protein